MKCTRQKLVESNKWILCNKEVSPIEKREIKIWLAIVHFSSPYVKCIEQIFVGQLQIFESYVYFYPVDSRIIPSSFLSALWVTLE